MRNVLKLLFFIIILISRFSSLHYADKFNLSVDKISRLTKYSDYTIKVYIESKCFLITYNSDGYIINIVEDDE